MATKQTYYLMNHDEQKLKSLRNYYVKQLKAPNLKTDKKEKYEAKLEELNAKLVDYDMKRNAKKCDDEDKRLKSLRYYYVKQLKVPNLDNDKKVKYEAKLNELNQKISNIEKQKFMSNGEINEANLEELNQQKLNYENKLNSINELKLKYENKLREINEMINTLRSAEGTLTTTQSESDHEKD